ncbi:hypothetical protein KIPB_001310, partial [Kipferlia bialata]|eukprot:g1310.t1
MARKRTSLWGDLDAIASHIEQRQFRAAQSEVVVLCSIFPSAPDMLLLRALLSVAFARGEAAFVDAKTLLRRSPCPFYFWTAGEALAAMSQHRAAAAYLKETLTSLRSWRQDGGRTAQSGVGTRETRAGVTSEGRMDVAVPAVERQMPQGAGGDGNGMFLTETEGGGRQHPLSLAPPAQHSGAASRRVTPLPDQDMQLMGHI